MGTSVSLETNANPTRKQLDWRLRILFLPFDALGFDRPCVGSAMALFAPTNQACIRHVATTERATKRGPKSDPKFRLGSRVAFHSGDFVEAALVAAAEIGGGQESLHHFHGGFGGDDAAA
jgi:hypothetical protein